MNRDLPKFKKKRSLANVSISDWGVKSMRYARAVVLEVTSIWIATGKKSVLSQYNPNFQNPSPNNNNPPSLS